MVNEFYEECELNHLQKLLNIDTSALLLTNYVDTGGTSDWEAYYEYISEQLDKVKSKAERNALELEIAEAKEKLLKEQQRWNDINEIETLILDFKNKLLEYSNLEKEIRVCTMPRDYFSLENNRIGGNLLSDLDNILQFIAFAKSKGEQKFAFYFM